MKVTYNWLKDFVQIKISPRALADKLTMAGLEVTALEERDGDFVFELEITSNRPDCLSVIGIAREVAAITKSKAKSKKSKVQRQIKNLEHGKLEIKIQDKKDCPLYTAKIIRGVKVGPSPEWLKKRLEFIGCRSVNSIVDITNYILFTYGEPLHAFDLDRLGQDTIIVRRAKDNERLTAIDGQRKILSPEILVIADKERPVAIAGIMGGRDTEVTERTQNILLEAAIFNPVMVRRARVQLGTQSESAYRFERGVDLEVVNSASGQAVELIRDFCGGKCVLAKSSGTTKTKKKGINLAASTAHQILGADITPNQIKQILNGLEFKLKPKAPAKGGGAFGGKNNFVVSVPSHRLDVNSEIDLIEEIARIYGYDRIPKTLAKVTPYVTASDTRSLVSLIKNILAGLGLNEVITYSLTDKAAADSSAIEILNPLSNEQEILRSALAPSLLKCASYNLNQKQDQINIFEIAKVFQRAGGFPQEELVLGIALSAVKSIETSFLHLKGILEVLFERLGIKEYSFNLAENVSRIELAAGGQRLGIMARMPKGILDCYDIKNKEIFITEISLDKLLALVQLKKRFAPLPVYPGVSRDISLILKDNIQAKEVTQAIREKGGALLREVKIIDYYKGKQIPADSKGLTISCLYRADERTLTEAEINPLHALICTVLKDRFNAAIR